jgi:hypothetical protein
MEILPLEIYPTPPVEPNVTSQPAEQAPPPEQPPAPPPETITEEHQVDTYA